MITKLLIFISFIVIFIFLVWEIIELRNIRKKLDKSNTEINDSNYFDLNAKLKSIIAIGTFVVFIIGFLGWNTFDNINEDVKNKLSSVDSLSASVELINTEMENIVSFIENFSNVEKRNLENYLSEIKNKVNNLSNNLLVISNEIKTKISSIDIIKNLTINRKEFNPRTKKSKRFFYKEMTTNKGKSLPKFDKTPLLMIYSNYGVDTVITEETSEYFDLTVHVSIDCEECLFDLIIFY